METLALVLAPSLFWLWFFYHKDALHPEPRWLVAKTFLLGMLAVVPAAIVEGVASLILPYDGSGNVVFIFLGMMMVVGPAEELSKYAAVRWSIWGRPDFDEPVDGLVYAAAGALGFATVENVLYALQFGASVMLARGPISTLGHVLFAASWGYALGIAGQLKPGKGVARIRKGLLAASLAHGAFDFFVFAGQIGSGWALLVPLAYLLLLRMWNVTMSEFASALRWRPRPSGARAAGGPATTLPEDGREAFRWAR
jgi:RsiW-degrading membrane proteinase PrsW (M82 family)